MNSDEFTADISDDRKLLSARQHIELAESLEQEANALYNEAHRLLDEATGIYRSATAIAARAIFELTDSSTPN